MALTKCRAGLLALCALAVTATSGLSLQAQTKTATHILTIGNARETIDSKGRIVLVAQVAGDLPGILTLALNVSPSGVITSGEWALNVTYTKFSPAVAGGDGDPGEVLMHIGFVKGTVSTGIASVDHRGLATSFAGLHLNVTGTTGNVSGATQGSGSLVANSLDTPNASSGSLTISF